MSQQVFSGGLCCTPCSFGFPSIFGANFGMMGNMFGCGLFGGNIFGSNLFGNGLFGMPAWNIFGGIDGLPFTPAPEFGYIPPVNFTPISLPSLPSLTSCTNPFGFITTKSYNTNSSLPSLQQAGYNKTKAQRLAAEIAKDSKEGGFDNLCAKHVKIAIQDAGLGSYQQGHGYQMADVLANNKNFKEIKVSGSDLSSLPAGCVLVYDRGVSGYSSKYGHTEITLGDGTAASGGITHNIRSGARVFVPV